jgi:hypothetical protein
MPSKLIMTVSAIFLALLGIGLIFLPAEIAAYAGLGTSKNILLLLQTGGALYFGFAMLNWTAKGSVIGGIYNKPITLANFMHFVVGALALVKSIVRNREQCYLVWILAGLYSAFAVLFWLMTSRSPVSEGTV